MRTPAGRCGRCREPVRYLLDPAGRPHYKDGVTALSMFRAAHIATGGVALITFWIPLVARKGGRLHRRVGWIYSVAMWLAAACGAGVCVLRLGDADPSNDPGAYFLLFVGLLSAVAASAGIRAIRTRKRPGRPGGAFDIGVSAVFFASSAALLALGLRHRSTLFLAFAALGLALSVGQLRYWLRAPQRMAWWPEHVGQMLTACIGTVTAFLVVNVPRLGFQEYALWFWFGPGVIGGVAITVLQSHYRRKFARAERA